MPVMLSFILGMPNVVSSVIISIGIYIVDANYWYISFIEVWTLIQTELIKWLNFSPYTFQKWRSY